MLRKEILLAALPAIAFGTAASAQKLLAPADPIAAIEGEWTGNFSKSRIRVQNGTVTLVHLDPKDAHHGFKEGMVIGRLTNGGKTINDGRGYTFSSSQCLVRYTRNRVDSFRMEPCGERGSSLATGTTNYEFYVSGMGFRRPKDEASKSASSTKPEKVKPAPASRPKAAESSKPTTGEFIQSAENKAKYEAELAAYRQTIADQQEAERRKQAAHAANLQEAAKAQDAYAAKLAAHRRELDAANARQQAYMAAQRRHALCTNGDKQACADIAAGTTTMAAAPAPAGAASTDTEATTCVSRPVVSSNATFAGNTAAMVVNGCPTAVDVRICLMREGGWNCGVKWGLQPQERWSHSSFKASGQIFWDARVSGSSEALESPAGS
jgi:phage host-nuclease inhibitor protein Gam